MERDPGLGRAMPQEGPAAPTPQQTQENSALPFGNQQVLPPPTGLPLYVEGSPSGTRFEEAKAAKGMTLNPPGIADLLFAFFLLVMGYCFWDWQLISGNSTIGIGATLFFWLLLAVSCLYLYKKGISQTWRSLAVFGVALAAAMPFALLGSRQIDVVFVLFECCLCLFWLALSCKTLIAPKIAGTIVFDLLSQAFITPFANFGQLLFRSIDSLKQQKAWKQVLVALIGLAVSLPLIFVVVFLLESSDAGFSNFLTQIQDALALESPLEYLLKFVLGIPVACYIFGAVAGNAFKRYSPFFEQEPLERTFLKVHALPRISLYAVLIFLASIYVVYLLIAGNSLIASLQGNLPENFSYAEHARQGFFELCWVSVINLSVLGVCWIFARRAKEEHPVILRILTGLIVVETCLLVIVAAAKMWLYVEEYGLTPLRMHTSWFMLVLLTVFVIILLWQLRPFNIARPLVAATIALTLLLSFTNVNGLISHYNVATYLSGQTERVDTSLLEQLSDAAVPALRELEEQATDEEVQLQADQALFQLEPQRSNATGEYVPWEQWYSANLTSYLAWKED